MSADPTFPGFVMSDEEEDARLAMQDTDLGVLSRGLAHVAPPPLDPMQMPLEELERLAAMEQLRQFDTPQVDYSAIPNYPAQAAQRHESMMQVPPGVEPSRNFPREAADYTLNAMRAKIPQAVSDFEPLTFMATGQLNSLPDASSQGQGAEGSIQLLEPTDRKTPDGRVIYRNNKGGFSSELSVTFPMPDGTWVNAPSIYNGQILSEDRVRDLVMETGGVDPETGRKLETFGSHDEAIRAARERSGTLDPGMPTSALPLSPSLGQAAQMIFPQSSEEIPYEFLPFDELAGLLKHAPDMNAAMMKGLSHGTRRSAADDILQRGFRPEALRSGTGGQAQGAGYYFAQNKGVAGSYRELAGRKHTVTDFLDELPEDAGFDEVLEVASSGGFSPQMTELVEALQADDWLGFDYPSQAINQAFRPDLQDNFDVSQRVLDAIEDQGALLEVDLDVDLEDLLDWDAPLSEQPPKVREVLERVEAEQNFMTFKSGKGGSRTLVPADMSQKTGQDFYKAIAGRDKMAASEVLREAGIPGVAYLDQGSRGKVSTEAKRIMSDALESSQSKEAAIASLKKRIGESMDRIKAGKITNYIGTPADPTIMQEAVNVLEETTKQTRNIVIFPGGEDLIHPKKLDGLPIAPKEIVGENAKDLVFYHGGGADLGPGDTLDPSAAIQSRAQFASAKRGVAEEFAGMADESGGTGRVVEVRIDKEAVVERAEYWQLNDDDYLDAARERGVDVLYTDSADAGAPGIAVLNNHVVRVPE